MDIRQFLPGRDRFRSPEEIIRIAQERRTTEPGEPLAPAEAMLISQTSKQQTWLVATKQNLYCVLDDLPMASTTVRWAMPNRELVADGQAIVPISTRSKSDRTGRLDIGKRKGWLFSKQLFTSEPIEARVRRLISGADDR